MRKILEADAFLDRPLEWAGNQCGHICVGLFSVFFLSILHFQIWGELPDKMHVFFVVILGYVLFELCSQRWNGWDTVEDTTFVALYGAGAPLTAFSEITPGSASFKVDEPIEVLMWFFIVASAHLLAGMAWRAIKA